MSPEEQFERELIEVFSDLADLFGNPRSSGQIYGLLFASPHPLTMEQIAAKLHISMGSVSNGLRALEGFGAVEKKEATTHRGQAHYTALLRLRPLVQGFVENRLVPKLQASNVRLEGLQQLVQDLPAAMTEEARLRLERVTHWHQRAAKVVGAAEKLIRMV